MHLTLMTLRYFFHVCVRVCIRAYHLFKSCNLSGWETFHIVAQILAMVLTTLVCSALAITFQILTQYSVLLNHH